jgi:hypothetical protein
MVSESVASAADAPFVSLPLPPTASPPLVPALSVALDKLDTLEIEIELIPYRHLLCRMRKTLSAGSEMVRQNCSS